MRGVTKVAAFQNESQVKGIQGQMRASNVFTSHRVIVPGHCSSWFEALREKLNELTALPFGWDGYVGKPVSFQVANFAAAMLERLCSDDVPAPSLVPGSDGSLQVEWHRNSYDVELDILGVQNVVATRYNHKTDVEEIIEIQSDFSEIVDWVGALSNLDVAEPVAA